MQSLSPLPSQHLQLLLDESTVGCSKQLTAQLLGLEVCAVENLGAVFKKSGSNSRRFAVFTVSYNLSARVEGCALNLQFKIEP